MRPAELPGAAALFCFYPHIWHVVVQPGKTGGVGVPVLVAHARRAFDAEVGRWRAGPRGPPPCCPGPGRPAPPPPASSRARTCPSGRGRGWGLGPGSRWELPRREGLIVASPVCRGVGGLCALGISPWRAAAPGGHRRGAGRTGPRPPCAPFASVLGLSAAG